MRTSSVFDRASIHARQLSRCLLLFTILCLSIPVYAQQDLAENDKSLSASVVLVLKLVSTTQVKPTTGIVISDDGLVLVPASLVLEPGEIVVLDNGTDIAVNGRPALITDRPRAGGLALISVPGLKRPGITLSENALEADQSLHLETFPPPKLMAEGADPLWVPVEISPQDSIMRAAISPQTPLPFITGPIIDGCGYFAGLSLAIGASSMELDKLPIVAFTDELVQIFDAMQVSLPSARCQGAVKPQLANSIIETKQVADAQSPAEIETTDALPDPESVVEESLHPPEQAEASEAAALAHAGNDQTSIWSRFPGWLITMGVLIFAALVWKSIALFRLARDPDQRQEGSQPSATPISASDEPDTAKLDAQQATSDSKPRSAPLDPNTIPKMDALPAGCNAVVVIEGLFNAKSPFKRYCAVDNGNIDIEFGRGEADISIEHPLISRKHARLTANQDAMTFSDLGSSNGTFINGIPCLPGEIMFIETGDEVVLGKLKISIKVVNTQEQLA